MSIGDNTANQLQLILPRSFRVMKIKVSADVKPKPPELLLSLISILLYLSIYMVSNKLSKSQQDISHAYDSSYSNEKPSR